MVLLESIHVSHRPKESWTQKHTPTYYILWPVTCPRAALRKTVLTSGDLAKNIKQVEKGCGLIIAPWGRRAWAQILPLHPPWVSLEMLQPISLGFLICTRQRGRAPTSELRGDFKKAESILYKAKHRRGLPLLPSSHPTAYCHFLYL